MHPTVGELIPTLSAPHLSRGGALHRPDGQAQNGRGTGVQLIADTPSSPLGHSESIDTVVLKLYRQCKTLLVRWIPEGGAAEDVTVREDQAFEIFCVDITTGDDDHLVRPSVDVEPSICDQTGVTGLEPAVFVLGIREFLGSQIPTEERISSDSDW